MSAGPSPAPSNSRTTTPILDLLAWFAIGSIAVALFFSASVYVPQRAKLPGLTGVVLGIVAGWGLGKWAAAKNLQHPAIVVILTCGMIATGEVLAAVQTHRHGLAPERSAAKPDELQRDMLTEGMRQYFAHEPEDLAGEDLARWREARDLFEQEQRRHEEAREAARLHRSFYGYLVNRLDPKRWGKWSYPWPALFWGAEVLLAGTAGAWVALWVLRSAAPGTTAAPPQPISDAETQGTRR